MKNRKGKILDIARSMKRGGMQKEADSLLKLSNEIEPGLLFGMLQDTGNSTPMGGRVFKSSDYSKDTYVHFTLLSRAFQIEEAGKILINPPYDTTLDGTVHAVSVTWGSYTPGVQSNNMMSKSTKDDELVAILFQSNTKPEYGYIEEVVWKEDVILINPSIIPASMAEKLLKGNSIEDQDYVVFE